MALYRQLKFPSTFIEYRSVSECKGVVVISNFESLEAPLQIYRPRQLPSLPRPKFAPGYNVFMGQVYQITVLLANRKLILGRVHKIAESYY